MDENPKAELMQYYSCIRYVTTFKEHLKANNELYYKKQIGSWTEYRNKSILENETLKQRKGWFTPFNNRLDRLMVKVVYSFKQVIEWKENQTDLQPDTIELVLTKNIQPLREMVTGIKMNYDSNKYLACLMQEYCINGFELMLIFLKDSLLIDIKNTPTYYLIIEVIDEYRNAIDFNKAQFLYHNEVLKPRDINRLELPDAQPEPEAKKNQNKKPGRPKAERLPAVDLLTDKIYNKEKFLQGLKRIYAKSDPKEFVYLLKNLSKLDFIVNKPRVTYYSAFETYFGEGYSNANNKNAFWIETEDKKLMEIIEKRLIQLKDDSIM